MKENYSVPYMESVKPEAENFICYSETTGIDSDRTDYGDPQDLTW